MTIAPQTVIDEEWLNGSASADDGDVEGQDKTLADSFPASDPPAQP